MKKQFIKGTGLGGGIGSILYTETSATQEREYFLYNVIGSVVVTTNADASVKSTNLYEAFGKVVATTGASDNNRLFCTKERSESIGLDNFGFRYFDWAIGRFIQRDPLGYPDGLNNYLYCSNNPINRIDPLGVEIKKRVAKAIEQVKKIIPETVEKINGRYPRNAHLAGRKDVKLDEINPDAKKETLEKYKDLKLNFNKEGLLDLHKQAAIEVQLILFPDKKAC